MTDLDEMQKRLKAIAEVVNSFKSESVQLRVVEVLLGQLGAPPGNGNDVTRATPKRAKRRKASTKAEPSAKEPKAGHPAKPARKATRGSASPGAFAMITQLLGDGFFKTPRTISAIVAYCSTSKGHHYKANECSPSLLRLLRDEKLKREKNKDGQYEYTQA
jgi:hypothetical protein